MTVVEAVDRLTARNAAPAYPIYDADHHYYETPDAFSRHLPKAFQRYLQYVTVNGRTKLALDGVLSDYIPNPTFEVVAAPGSHELFYRAKNSEGLSLREMTGKPIASRDAFHSGAAHLKVMDEQAIAACVVFPTLASVIETRLHKKPQAIGALFNALNRWVEDEYGFTNGRQFPAAMMSLGDVDGAVAELDRVLAAGARVVAIRPAPVPDPFGGRSPGDKAFDPFWARCAEAKVMLCFHSSDSGYDWLYRYWTEGESGDQVQEYRPFERNAFKWSLDDTGRYAADAVSAMICYGAFDRHPDLRLSVIECGASWVASLLQRLHKCYGQFPREFARDPVETFRRHVSVAPFYEDSVREIVDLIGIDNVLFGSDWPHPEGLRVPLDFYNDLTELTPAEQEQVMSSNLRRLLEGVR